MDFFDENFDPIGDLVSRFEKMLAEGSADFFEPEEYVSIIDFYIMKSMSEEAENAVNLAKALYSNNIEVEIAYSHFLFYKGQNKKALSVLENLMSCNPNDVDVIFAIASLYSSIGNHEKAICILESIDKIDDDTFAANVFLADEYIQVNDVEKCKKLVLDLCEFDPSDTFPLEMLSELLDFNKLYDDKIKLFSEYTKKDPFNKYAWAFLSEGYKGKKDFDKALESIDFALALDPELSQAIIDKGYIYMLKDDYNNAIDCFAEVIKIIGEDSTTLSLIAECYYFLSDYTNAIMYFEKCIDLDPLNVDAHYCLADIYSDKICYNEALKHIDIVINNNDFDTNYCILKSDILEKMDRLPEAEKIIRQAIDVCDQNASLWLRFVELTDNLYGHEAAMDLLDKAIIKAKEENIILYYRKAAMLLESGRNNMGAVALDYALSVDETELQSVFDYNESLKDNETLKEVVFKFNNNKN